MTGAEDLALLDRRLLVVTGKGGVGKSTVAAALALLAASRGKRTAVVEVSGRDDISRMFGAASADPFHELTLGEHLLHVTVDPEHALHEYLADQLPVRAMAEVLERSRAFAYLTAATPGLRELLTFGKVWELAQDPRRTPGASPYDLVVLDAPATGHAVAMLESSRTFADAARVGPIARQGRTITEMVVDAHRTAVVAVTTAEELPVTETLTLRDAARRATGHDPALVVVNAVRPDRLTAADVRVLEAARARTRERSVAAPITAALRANETAREHRAQIARLRRGLGGDLPLVTLPFSRGGDLSPDDLRAFARILARRSGVVRTSAVAA
ncbi:ArsA-related P-loop ATPase [Paraconexibacter sp.]|uniref:ArsA-related P-loop ATPase n=1 Tax=Paraconexibacter sp. TaxID=2949640 RepID=UPI00356879E8